MIEYVKVKHNEECYICHSSKNVKTLRVAAVGSNAANTIAFCDKCAGTVSRVLNVPMTFERSLDGEVVCPHCKTIIGFDAELVVSNYTIGFVVTDVEYNELWNQIRLSGE